MQFHSYHSICDENFPVVLTIAGSDSGGGAGIQADLKTFQMRKIFGTTAITAVTAQNTLGVSDIYLVSCENIKAQIQAVAEDFSVQAVKIGMLGNRNITLAVAESLKKYHFPCVVLDPVMIAKGGTKLLRDEAIQTLRHTLLPLVQVITPNLPEAEALTGIQIIDEESLQQAGRELQKIGVPNVIIKGGHLADSQSEFCTDWIFTPTEVFTFQSPRFETKNTHGTGCTFSACLTAELAKGKTLKQAIKIAKDFITAAIQYSFNLGQGHGPTNHWAYQDEEY